MSTSSRNRAQHASTTVHAPEDVVTTEHPAEASLRRSQRRRLSATAVSSGSPTTRDRQDRPQEREFTTDRQSSDSERPNKRHKTEDASAQMAKTKRSRRGRGRRHHVPRPQKSIDTTTTTTTNGTATTTRSDEHEAATAATNWAALTATTMTLSRTGKRVRRTIPDPGLALDPSQSIMPLLHRPRAPRLTNEAIIQVHDTASPALTRWVGIDRMDSVAAALNEYGSMDSVMAAKAVPRRDGVETARQRHVPPHNGSRDHGAAGEPSRTELLEEIADLRDENQRLKKQLDLLVQRTPSAQT